MKKLLLFGLIAGVSGLFLSCSEDRVEAAGFVEMDAFYDKHKEEEQVFTITTDSGDCITGKKGTVVCPIRNHFSMGEDSVQLPYELRLIELYGVKDYILNRKASTAGTSTLATAGMVKTTTWKDNVALNLRDNKTLYVKLAGTEHPEGYEAYFGTEMVADNFESGTSISLIDWQLNTGNSTITRGDDGSYVMQLARQGWSTAADVRSDSLANITFDIEATGTEHIQLYAVPSSYEGVVRGENLVLSNVPAGQVMTIVAFAKDKFDNYRLFHTNGEITGDMNIELEMEEVSEDNLLSFLASL